MRYTDNYQQMLQLCEQLQKHLEQSRFQGSPKHLQKAKQQGKLTARERIELLLDPDSFFLELMPLIGLGGEGFGPGGTTVSGIGLVEGRICLINANVGTNKSGAIDKATLQKNIRISQIALENGLPTINLVESSGANLPEQEQIFNYGGAIFRDLTQRSKAGIPTISVVFGNSTAGGAYVPGMSDYAILVKDKAKVFLAGPPLVKMATQEVTDEESLGGANMHARISGVADYLAEDELDALRLARQVLRFLPPTEAKVKPSAVVPPKFPIEDLLELVPADIRHPFDVRELILRLVDGSDFSEFKPLYGETLVTGWAKIHGYSVGIIANNGVIFSEAANKGAHFIQLCNQAKTPILFLQNTTGFMVGRMYEERGIIKDGAKLINAVSNSEVPAITVLIGASYGAGNYAMSGRAYNPRFLFSYPNARIAVMGPQQLSGVMELIQREAAEKMGIPFDEASAAEMRNFMMQQVEKSSTAWYATGQGWDDGLIDPRQTRDCLGICLAVVQLERPVPNPSYGIFRM